MLIKTKKQKNKQTNFSHFSDKKIKKAVKQLYPNLSKDFILERLEDDLNSVRIVSFPHREGSRVAGKVHFSSLIFDSPQTYS